MADLREGPNNRDTFSKGKVGESSLNGLPVETRYGGTREGIPFAVTRLEDGRLVRIIGTSGKARVDIIDKDNKVEILERVPYTTWGTRVTGVDVELGSGLILRVGISPYR